MTEAAEKEPGATKKKRVAERQITKDDGDNDSQQDDTEEQPSMGFQKADEETLKKRRIVKAKRTGQATKPNGEDEAPKTNPFAKLASSSSVFGSGFKSSGFGANNTSGGFGFGKSGGGFSVGSGFGAKSQAANSSTASVFGSGFSGTSSESASTAFGATSSSSKPEAHAFPDEMELKTGEEDEVCVLEVRAKTHQFVEKNQVQSDAATKQDSAPSVPPSSSNTTAAKEKDEKSGQKESDTTMSAEQDETTKEKPKESQEETNQDAESKEGKKEEQKPKASSKKHQDWQELGIGPLRILRKSKGHSRVVQRRESAPGGAGTKLLINAPLSKESQVTRPSDQHVRFTTIEPSGKAAIYLFKFKLKAEANRLENVLKTELANAASLVDGAKNEGCKL
jgi:hypothetical protein